MAHRRATLSAVLIAATFTAGCTSGTGSSVGPLPDGKTELAKAAESMRSVQSTHFTITVDGELPGVPVRNADGDLTSSGTAKGNAKVSEFGQLVQLDFVLADGTAFIKGPTGGYQKMSATLATAIYDPATILNADKGVSKVLSSVESPEAEAQEDDAYRISGKVSKAVVSSLVPGIASDVTGKFWISSSGQPYLKQAKFDVPNGQGKAMVTVVLSNINAPVTITAPA
ncbi:lipoarabinomannan carrier protein LprG [Kutzneria viridogrisea]|uniref:Lipoprotein LprG n=1 Tax=Kutzneria viridogrisea TaxID=47990 RepID=A0ABR6BT68_9PSEU|nr:lipoprotein LprG [Kutzneria viridogrisea]